MINSFIPPEQFNQSFSNHCVDINQDSLINLNVMDFPASTLTGLKILAKKVITGERGIFFFENIIINPKT